MNMLPELYDTIFGGGTKSMNDNTTTQSNVIPGFALLFRQNYNNLFLCWSQ